MDFSNLKFVVVGSGFFGAVIAEQIARDLGERVVVLEKREHVGGNCFSRLDAETGIEYHQYGTHVFHTSRPQVWEYINQFTEFNSYRHQVLSQYRNKIYQMPINLETINSFYNLNLRPYEAREFLKEESAKAGIQQPVNFEDQAIAMIGRPLYEAFIKGYTIKQWQKDPRELSAHMFSRLPVRYDYNESYFFDQWQGIPLDGFTQIFHRILQHRNIEVLLKTDYLQVKNQIPASCLVIYSGPLDRLFGYRFGQLEWRSLTYQRTVVPVNDYQGTAVMNFPEMDVPFTRVHEPRHLHLEREYPQDKTLIFEEFSCQADSEREPYYPIDVEKNRALQQLYIEEAQRDNRLILGGRLADYKYYDMDETIATALNVYEQQVKPKIRGEKVDCS